MSNIRISFESPFYLLLLIPVLAIILFPFFMMPRNRRYTIKRIIPVVLHTIIAAVLIFVLAGFAVVRSVNEQAVILLVDLSYSTEKVQETILSHTKQLLSMIDETTPVGVVVFGREQVYSVDLESNNRTFAFSSPGGDATDLEEALVYTASLAPKDKALRIILLTDGKETDGNADRAAYDLAQKGIRLDTVYYDTTHLSTSEVQLGSFTAPEGIYKDSAAILTAEIKSNMDCEALIKLYENDALLTTQSCAVVSGSNMIEMTVMPQSSGIYTYHLVLEVPHDTILENNEAYACLPVAGESTVLIIADSLKNAAALENVLASENAVTTVLAYAAPKTITELCNYDSVILSNVDYYALPNGYDKLLETYVATYGRTLLAVGGNSTFMYGDMQNTALNNMFPVSLSLEKSTEGKSVALMLVLDCSSSMVGDNIVIAKQGAIKCLDAMTDNDYVGVISFSKTANLESPLLRSDQNNKEALVRVISGLEIARGTYYTEAIEMARAELQKSDADVKHILFLSDGQPGDDGYYAAAGEAGKEGITVSTIGLGYSSYILSTVADYGNGRYYYVSSAEELPDIMLSETEQARVSSLIIGDFVPVIKEASPLTDALKDAVLPTLGGYLGTTLKSKATAYLTTEAGHPVFASWDYGFGKVACFTSDLNGTWSDRWLSDEIGQALTLGMVKTTVDNVHHESTLVPEIELYGKTAKLAVTTTAETDGSIVQVTVNDKMGENRYSLIQVYPGRYEVSIPLRDSGVYDLYIAEIDINGNVVDELNTAMAVSYSPEYDAFFEGSEQFLYNLCGYSQGKLHTDLKALAGIQMPDVKTVHDPIVPMSVLLAILILSDIAVRKIRWKDLKAYFIKLNSIFKKQTR